MSRPTSGRPVAARRTMKRGDDDINDLKAAYLVVAKSLTDDLETGKQLHQALQQTGRNPPKRLLQKFWTDDTDGVDFDDFCDICRKIPPTTEDELIKAFRKIDINGDGYISNSELQHVLTTRGEKMSKDEVQDIIDEVDENRDGKLDYKEFCKMLLSTQDECKKLALRNMEKITKKSTKRDMSPRGKRDLSPRDRGKREPSPYERGKSPRTTQLHNGPTHDIVHSDSFGSQSSIRSNTSSVREPASLRQPASLREPAGLQESASLREPASLQESASPREGRNGYKNTKMDNSDSEDSDDIVIGSTASLRKDLPRSDKKGRTTSPRGHDRDSSRKDGKEWMRPAPTSKELRLNRPKKLKDWGMAYSNGCFYFDEDGHIVSHQYEMTLTRDSSVWMTVEPLSLRPGDGMTSAREVKSAPIDTLLYIVRSDGTLVNYTQQRDDKGVYGVRCDMVKGKYMIIPFTTGCRFRRRTSKPHGKPQELIKQKGDSYILTKPFKEALGEIFTMCDLDGNGSLSREEFNWFNLRTSGEEVADEEWEVVEENVELKNGELTKNGFIKLNQMEAEDNNGDTSDLWVTLSSMGFNQQLIVDEAAMFVLETYTEYGEPKLSVSSMERMREQSNSAILDVTMGKGEKSSVKQMKDLCLYSHVTDLRACLVIQNKSQSRVRVEADCSSSKNVLSHRAYLKHTVNVPPKTSVIAHHILPVKETQDWILRCQESVVK